MAIKADLPRQLQRQAEEVEQYDRDMAAKAATPPPAEPPPETPKASDGQDTPPPAPTPAPTPPSDDVWKQRYLTLEGKYKAEVPRLHNQIKELSTKIDELVARSSRPPETPPADPKPKSKRVTEKDTETFGADLLDVIKRQAEEIAADAIADLQTKVTKLASENEQLKAQVTGVSSTQSATAQEIYFGKLAAAVPDWEAINTSEGFLNWLGEVDELSGATRQAYLDHAFQNLDVQRTAKLFNAYKNTLPKAPEPPAPKKQEVQRQVAPGKSKTPPGPPAASDAASKIWTSSEIEKFYREVQSGHYRSNPAEAARIEAEIDAAVATGRVRA